MSAHMKKAIVFALVLAVLANIDVRKLPSIETWKLYAAATHVDYTSAASGGSPEKCTITPTGNAGVGNSAAMLVHYGGNSTVRTHTISGGNTWTKYIEKIGIAANANDYIQVYASLGLTTADTTIDVTQSGGSEIPFTCYYFEWSDANNVDTYGAGFGNCLITTTSCDTFENGANATIYGSDNAGSNISVSAGAYIILGSHSGTANGGYTSGSCASGCSYTRMNSGTTNFVAYAIASTSIADEPGAHTQATTRRAQNSYIIAFAPSAAAAALRGGLLGVLP